ncbi:hypothetical protein D9757_000747 [Collybiopsis confluens]|uniref:TPR-like protein n=1 Tax=Collybiopsis confluens TaxID=2823264 RepID=A0A8H5I0Y4_9AGAR|nr:hypothetical protein D9757_000747 [Collybiopsis confluens]
MYNHMYSGVIPGSDGLKSTNCAHPRPLTMALPMLVSGAECGPSNPLQGLSKRFDNDRGLQQDYFGPGRAGTSQETFRSQPNVQLQPDKDAVQFFTKTPHPHLPNAGVYELGALQNALPAPQAHQLKHVPAANWAADFLTQQPIRTFSPIQSTPSSIQDPSTRPITQAANSQIVPWNNGSVPTWGLDIGMGMRSAPGFAQTSAIYAPHTGLQESSQISWDKEFDAQQIHSLSTAEPSQSQKEILHQPQEQDELARTAGLLLETVKSEQNPKFQNSQFMSLMSQLRDQKVVVRGNEMVENDGTIVQSRVDTKGKGRAVDPPSVPGFGSDYMRGSRSSLLQRMGISEVVTYPSELDATQMEDENDAYFRRENEDYIRYWNSATKPVSNQNSAFDRLQEDWDAFEASTHSIQHVTHYQFQKNNPYLSGERSRTRHHSMHSDERLERQQTVLELEAAVQTKLSDASAWFDLGVKQQEHEREMQALQALTRATELDPSYLPGWLALSVSFTNDGRRLEAYDAIRQWVIRNGNHRDIVRQHFPEFSDTENTTPQEKFSQLVQCLIAMAQQSAVGRIDADIQIALAVLFNSNEEYEKAQDCFRAALSVRPDDWQLYNRVGATMANSGQAAEALQYYYRALDLNPAYIRARSVDFFKALKRQILTP